MTTPVSWTSITPDRRECIFTIGESTISAIVEKDDAARITAPLIVMLSIQIRQGERVLASLLTSEIPLEGWDDPQLDILVREHSVAALSEAAEEKGDHRP